MNNPRAAWCVLVTLLILSTIPAKSADVLKQFNFEAPSTILVKELPKLKLENPVWSEYIAIQYGAKKDDVVVFIFDATDELKPFDRLWIWSPNHRDFKIPVLVKGVRSSRSSSSGRKSYFNRFRPVKVDGKTGWSTIMYSFLFHSNSSGIELVTTCSIEKSGRRCRFILKGDTHTSVGPSAIISVVQPIAEPDLRMSMDNRASVSRLVIRIMMGGNHMLPVSGMSSKVSVIITDHKTGRFRARHKLELDEINYEKGYKLVPSKPLMRGRIYLATVEIDLGRIFGPMKETHEIVPSK